MCVKVWNSQTNLGYSISFLLSGLLKLLVFSKVIKFKVTKEILLIILFLSPFSHGMLQMVSTSLYLIRMTFRTKSVFSPNSVEIVGVKFHYRRFVPWLWVSQEFSHLWPERAVHCVSRAFSALEFYESVTIQSHWNSSEALCRSVEKLKNSPNLEKILYY